MPPRRYHKKSRTGCLACRSRRIKCDETWPVCESCQRAALLCDYRAAGQRSRAPRPASQSHEPELTEQSRPSEAPASADAPATFDMLDLSLMHYYTATTSISLFGTAQVTIWQQEIPTIAHSSPLLMHGLLATAALQASSLAGNEGRTYWAKALHHHNRGLLLFNPLISHITPASAPILFTFSLLLVVWAYASTGINATNSNNNNNNTTSPSLLTLLTSLDLVRGSMALLESHTDAIMDHPVTRRHLPTTRWTGRVRDLPAQTASILASLRNKAADVIDSLGIDHLERFLQEAEESGDDTGMATGWPATINGIVWKRVRDGRPLSVLTFMHYAVIVERHCRPCWWLEGWAEALVRAVEGVLGEADKERLEWAVHRDWVVSECRLLR